MPSNNKGKDEFDTQEWLNTDFFTKVLHSCEKDVTIKVKNFKLSLATVEGDNYASVMIRAYVEYENANAQTHSISMVIKTEHEVIGATKNSEEASSVFKTEIAVYTEVLPKFHAMLKQVGDETKLGPRYLYHTLSPKKCIVLEDIVPLGYSMLHDRPLNMEEAKLVYLKLAKWHALSYKINKENLAFFEQFKYDFMELLLKNIGGVIKNGIKLFNEMLNTQPALHKYQTYFKELLPDLIEKCSSAFSEYRLQPHKDTHYVLCHGDFRNKNMMFKRDSENQLKDILFFDFQLSFVGAMDLDVIYSIFMMLNKEFRLQHMEELINYYFTNFQSTLEQLGFEGKMPRIIEFREMLIRHGCFNIFMLVIFLPIFYDMERKRINKSAKKETQQNWYSNKDYLADLEECLPKYLNMGCLN